MKSGGHSDFTQGVRKYYERNTRWFLSFRSPARNHAIHRPVWAEEVDNLESALNYVNDLIFAQIQTFKEENGLELVSVVDLGCGVGGSLQYLARQLGQDFRAIGITLSPKQARLAHLRSIRLGVQDRCAFVEADFHRIPIHVVADFAISIEAFAHSIDPERYFSEAVRLLKPGGRLILCDDFQSEKKPAGKMTAVDRQWLRMFKSGWRVPHLLGPDRVELIAEGNGLRKVEERDLSPNLQNRMLPGFLAHLMGTMMKGRERLPPILGSVLGGIALEQCIGRGLVDYRYAVFEKYRA